MARKKKSRSPIQDLENFSLPHEAKGLILLIGAVLIYLSLVSFHDGQDQLNWLGLAGFTCAWILNYFFGLSSYLSAVFVGWWGWRRLWDKPVRHLEYRSLYLLVAMLGTSLLLCVWSERSTGFQHWIGDRVYSKQLQLSDEHPPKTIPKYYVGGVPLHYMYSEFPRYNLRRLLNDMGVSIIAMTMLVTALLALGKVQVRSLPDVWQELRKRWYSPDDCEANSSNEVSGARAFLPRLALPFHNWARGDSPEASPEDTPYLLEAEEEECSLIAQPTAALPSQLEHPEEEEEEDVVVLSPPPRAPPSKPISTSAATSTQPDRSALRKAALEAQSVWNGDFSRYQKPNTKLLTRPKPTDQSLLRKGLRQQADVLEETLQSFGIEAKVGQIHCGPSITSFEVHPPVGVKVQKIKALENDIALNMKAKSIRIIAPIPGKAAVGIEVPNPQPQEVSFREILDSYRRQGKPFAIPVLLGKTVTGEYVIADLAKMPHCIIAGATGSGKSVCINTIVMSILMNATPDEVRLLMVDPKKVELTPYTRLPHMLAPVITEPQGACAALGWLVREMERRYEMLKQVGVRNIGAFNGRNIDQSFEESLEIELPEKLPYIVCIIDELADLMMVSSNDIETPIARIAQMARAVGIHLILATQRPSREVITGIIKANFPTRICFKVSSRVNSQIVLDESGGESLLGNGDLLFLPPGTSTLVRAQGAFIRDEDITEVVQHICKQSPPNYLIESFDQEGGGGFTLDGPDSEEPRDSLYDQALNTVLDSGNASTTFLQRKLKIGYARAASIMDELEDAGVIGPADGSKARKVLAKSSSGPEEL